MTSALTNASSSAHREAIAKEAARLFEDVTHSSKSHFNDAAKWSRRHLVLGVVSALLATGAGATVLFSDLPKLGAFISLLSAAATAVLTFQKPEERAALHRRIGAGYNDLRVRARQLREIDALGPMSDDELQKMLGELTTRKTALELEAPVLSRGAFETARKGIAEGEAAHEVDRKPA